MDLPPSSSEPDALELGRGFGYAGFAAALLGLALFFVPFLDLLLTLIGLVLAGRSLHLYRASGTEPGETAWLLAICALILGVIGLVPGMLITYTAAFRTLTSELSVCRDQMSSRHTDNFVRRR